MLTHQYTADTSAFNPSSNLHEKCLKHCKDIEEQLLELTSLDRRDQTLDIIMKSLANEKKTEERVGTKRGYTERRL